MKSAGKARNNGLYRHIRTSKEIIRNLLNDYNKYKVNVLSCNNIFQLFTFQQNKFSFENGFFIFYFRNSII